MNRYIKKTDRQRAQRRFFTRAEDELIMRQPNGGYSLNALEDMIHASRETIERRALELGITLVIKKRLYPPGRRRFENRKSRPNEALPADFHARDSGANPVSVGRDKLLSRLIDEHGDRMKKEQVG